MLFAKINRGRYASMHNTHRNSTLSRHLEKTKKASTAVASPIVEVERTAAAIATAISKLELFIRSHLHIAPRIRENTLSFFRQINTKVLFWMGRVETRLHQCSPESRDSRQDKLFFRNNILGNILSKSSLLTLHTSIHV